MPILDAVDGILVISSIARMLFSGKIELGAVHTYLELFARYFTHLISVVPSQPGRNARPA